MKLNCEDSACFLKPESSQNQSPGLSCFSLLLSVIKQLLTLWQKLSKARLNHILSYSLPLVMSSPIVHSCFSLILLPRWAIVQHQTDVGLSSWYVQQKLHKKRCTFGAGVLEIGSMDPRELGGQAAPEIVYKAM